MSAARSNERDAATASHADVVAPAGVDLRWDGKLLRYSARLEQLPDELGQAFVPMTLDTSGREFIERARSVRPGAWRCRAHRVLTALVSDFDANGLLEMYPLFLLSQAQFAMLLGDAGLVRLLDVGAGAGYVTQQLDQLTASVDCTETSLFMARKLRAKGYGCWRVDLSLPSRRARQVLSRQHDWISLLNVIDRCPRPRSLLRTLVDHLPPGGILLLSTPLPYCAFFFDGGLTRMPRETLAIQSHEWEPALGELWQTELEPLGLSVRALTRAPYLSAGDTSRAWYALDSAVLVCEKSPSPPRPRGRAQLRG